MAHNFESIFKKNRFIESIFVVFSRMIIYRVLFFTNFRSTFIQDRYVEFTVQILCNFLSIFPSEMDLSSPWLTRKKDSRKTTFCQGIHHMPYVMILITITASVHYSVVSGSVQQPQHLFIRTRWEGCKRSTLTCLGTLVCMYITWEYSSRR